MPGRPESPAPFVAEAFAMIVLQAYDGASEAERATGYQRAVMADHG
jgi:hypothetical protein